MQTNFDADRDSVYSRQFHSRAQQCFADGERFVVIHHFHYHLCCFRIARAVARSAVRCTTDCFASGGLRTAHRGKNTLRLSACKGQDEHTYFVALIFPLWEAREVMPSTAEAINAQDFPLILLRVVLSSQRPEAPPPCQVKRLRTHRHEELQLSFLGGPR